MPPHGSPHHLHEERHGEARIRETHGFRNRDVHTFGQDKIINHNCHIGCSKLGESAIAYERQNVAGERAQAKKPLIR